MGKLEDVQADHPDESLRTEQTFPKLTDAQIDAIRPYGKEINVPAGAFIYHRGDRNIDFYVLLDGTIDVIEMDTCGKRSCFHSHTSGSFLGEINLFNSRKSLVSTQAVTPCRLIRVGRFHFKRLLSAEPELAKVILRGAVLRRTAFLRFGLGSTTIIGDELNPQTLTLRRFLIANHYPFRLLAPDTRDESGRLLVDLYSLKPVDLPAVLDTKERILRNPCLTDLAYQIGLLEQPRNGQIYDLVIVGAGPSGLAAAVYAGSEGLDTMVIDSWAPGGQAGTSSQIENYLGFPNGISGLDLAGRAQMQAEKFGVQLAIPQIVKDISKDADGTFKIFTGEQTFVPAKSVIVASGAKYRKLELPEYDRFEGHGIQYAATPMEAQLCHAEEACVIGAGNSAGQAAMFLSQTCSKVHMLVRGKALSSSMSNYLIDRIQNSQRIDVYYETEVTRLSGDHAIEEIEWKRASDGQTWLKPIRMLFVMIGAIPNTDWLRACIELDNKGFVVTGRSKESPYQTTVPGIFAIGDVRSESVKRVASAVGEGSVVVSWVQKYLSERPHSVTSERTLERPNPEIRPLRNAS